MKFNIILLVILGILAALIIPINAYALERDNNWNENLDLSTSNFNILDTKFLDNAEKKAVQASAKLITLGETVTILSTTPPSITSWNNSKTNDDSKFFKINISEAINFNATANQTIDTWNWTMDGSEVENNNFDNFSTSWDTAGIKTVSVNATNNTNGTSEPITWVITINPLPEIISWSNNKTNNNNTKSLKINISEAINFSVTADQTIDQWNWYKDGSDQTNDFDNYNTSWSTAGIKTVSVNATNDNGTTNTITWEIMVDPPEIISWSNNKTNDENISVRIGVNEIIIFNATADQVVTTWNWYIGSDKQENYFDNFNTSWDDVGERTVSVYANNSNGTTNTITWNVTIVSQGKPINKGRGGHDEDSFDLGDLIVLFRDDNGEPIFDDNGCVIPLDENGTQITMEYDALLGIYCELSEENLTRVVEVQFGRLAIARSPTVVLEQSFDEAISSINAALAIDLDSSGRILLTKPAFDEDGNYYEYQKPIDSSLENLALYKKLMLDGNLIGNLGDYDYIDLGDPGGEPALRPTLDVTHFNDVTNQDLSYMVDDTLDNEDLIRSASFLAAAADKTGHITVDLVVYLNSIMGLNVHDKDGDVYYDFGSMNYVRKDEYDIDVLVLQEVTSNICGNSEGYWEETYVQLFQGNQANPDVFTYSGDPAQDKIAGFVQASDDTLRVIYFVHTYQIPSLR